MNHRRSALWLLAVALLVGNGKPAAGQHRLERVDPVEVTPATPAQLGSFRSDESRTVRFLIRNNAQDPLRIGQVRAGCSCTTVVSSTPTPIAPGSSGQVDLTVLGRLLPEGHFSRSAIVELENSPLGSVILRYEGTIVCPIRVTPGRDVMLGDVPATDTGWSRTFEFTAGPEEKRKIVLGEPLVTGPAAVTLVGRGPSRYVLTLQPKSPPPGPFRVEVQVPVVEPAGLPPEVLTVRGYLGPRLVVQPTVLDIPEGSAPLQRDLRVTLLGADRPPLAIGEMTIRVPDGVTAVATPAADGITILLQISAAARRAGCADVVEIGCRRAPTIRVPYYVLQPPQRVTGRGATP